MTPFPRDRPDYTFQDPTPAQIENTRAIMKARPYTPTSYPDTVDPAALGPRFLAGVAPTSNDLVADYEHGVEHDPAPLAIDHGHVPFVEGSFACPICGRESPHFHTAAEVALHQATRPMPTVIDDIDLDDPAWARAEAYVAEPLVNHAGQENADCLPEAEFQTAFDEWSPQPLEPLPEPPALAEIELFMPEDIAHAVTIYRSNVHAEVDGSLRDIEQIRAMRAVMMFALQVATVNLGVHPDPAQQQTRLSPPAPTSKRFKTKAGRKANRKRRS